MPHSQTILADQIAGALDIVSRAGGHMMQEFFFGDAAGHEDGDLRQKVILAIGVLVVDGQLHGDAQRHAARDDGDLV